MLAARDLTGSRFGRLIVTHRAANRKTQTCWFCVCDCGTRDVVVRTECLTRGTSSSCGCLRREAAVARGAASKRHGEGANGKETAEYRAWGSMNSRCSNPNHVNYPNYGARGISVCERWRTSYEAFLADVGRRPSDQHSLDRYPNQHGNYEPGNVRWATSEEQNCNKRGTVQVTVGGVTQALSQWLRQRGISRSTFQRRRAQGMTDEEALTKHL